MGFAIAAEAARRGATVTVVAGPTTAAEPAVTELVRVRSAEQMHREVMARADAADVVIMAAAVADYTPETRAQDKISKTDGQATLVLRRTPDILKALGERRAIAATPQILVGFAAETENLIARASEKLRSKQVDLIVANDVSRADAGFDVDTNEVTLVAPDGNERVALASKTAIAAAILDRIETLVRARAAARSTE
jgi:phosphopantothenoylcysteine decarboxylase/phosphopantothenate--cysteine ligase